MRLTLTLSASLLFLCANGSAAATGMPEAGKSRTAISGCLKTGQPERGVRSPAPQGALEVTAVPGGVKVHHQFSHACCLKGSAKTTIQGRTVSVWESTSGRSCRCICSSTIDTVVGLGSGKWMVYVYFNGRRLGAKRVEVAGAGPTPAACKKTGCSGQVCADQNMMTTCEWRPQYACYRTAECKRQGDGKCGWTRTAALEHCLGHPPQSP